MLARTQADPQDKKIAVLGFPYHDGKSNSGSTIVQERLTTHIAGRRGVEQVNQDGTLILRSE